MGRLFGFIGVLAAVAVGAYVYSHQAKEAALGTNNPRAVVDVVGVRGDLLAIAQAERMHFASAGSYVGLDELISSGDLTMARRSRGPYVYDVEAAGATGFTATATCAGGREAGCADRVIRVDETMQVHSE